MDMKLVVPFETIDLLRQLAKKLHGQGDIRDALTLASAITDVVQVSGVPAFYADIFFGSCPSCGDCEEVLTIDNKRYGACHEHRVYWYLGTDFLDLSSDSNGCIAQNQSILAPYCEVPTAEAFAKNACPCCGFAIKHASWCIMSGVRRYDL
jgi:hypothetical protein